MRRDDRGTAAVELVLLTPLLLIALGFVVVAGRLGTVKAEISGAARDAARAASLQTDLVTAADAALETAAASLDDRTVTCANLVVELGEGTDFVAGGSVTVVVSCDVHLADVAMPGLPGTRTVSGESVEVIDLYRWVP